MTRLANDESPPAGTNVLAGTVADVIYVGTFTHYVVALPGGAGVVVHQQNRTLGEPGTRAGDAVRVAFAPACAALLAE
jgi:spermidine/putrescine transport system ATP-binding protein